MVSALSAAVRGCEVDAVTPVLCTGVVQTACYAAWAVMWWSGGRFPLACPTAPGARSVKMCLIKERR